MNVLGPGDRFTSVGVNAILSAFPAAGFLERSQIVSVTRDDSKSASTPLMFSIAAADFED